jgi:hypothetical protein
MKKFDELPKAIKKTIRYIKQDAPIEHLENLRKLLNEAINQRLNKSNKVG